MPNSFLCLSVQIHTQLSLFLKVERQKCYFHSQVGKLGQKCSVCWPCGVIGGGPNRQINPASEHKHTHTHLHTQKGTRKNKDRGETAQLVNQSYCCSLLQKTTENRKEVRKAFTKSLDPWQQFHTWCVLFVCVCVFFCNPLWIDKFRRSNQGQRGWSQTHHCLALMYASQRLLWQFTWWFFRIYGMFSLFGSFFCPFF